MREGARPRRRHTDGTATSAEVRWDQLGDLPLTRILELLSDARSLARCRCVCRSWRAAAGGLDARPVVRVALSAYRLFEKDAAEAVVHKCLSHSFEPNYGMLFVGRGYDISKFASMVLQRLPRKNKQPIPLIGCVAGGLIGPDCVTGKLRTVQWEDIDLESFESSEEIHELMKELEAQRGAVLILGRAPNTVITPFHIKRRNRLKEARMTEETCRVQWENDSHVAAVEIERLISGDVDVGTTAGQGAGKGKIHALHTRLMVLGHYLVDLNHLDRQMAALAGPADGLPPPKISGGLAARLPRAKFWKRHSSLFVSRGDDGTTRPNRNSGDDKDLVGLAFRTPHPCFEAVGAGGMSAIGPRYVVTDSQKSLLPTEAEWATPNWSESDSDDSGDEEMDQHGQQQMFIPISHITAVPESASSTPSGSTSSGPQPSAASIWMPRKGERGLTGRDLAIHLKDATGFDLDDPGMLLQPSIRLFPSIRPRANPPRRARAMERMNSTRLRDDQLTALGRVSVHCVFGYDASTMLVQGSGVQRGDRFQFQVPDPVAARQVLRAALNAQRRVEKPSCVGGVIFCSFGRRDLFEDSEPHTPLPVNLASYTTLETDLATRCTDAMQFMESFPGVPLGGMFSTGEIMDRPLIIEDDTAQSEQSKPQAPRGGIRVSQLGVSFALFTSPVRA